MKSLQLFNHARASLKHLAFATAVGLGLGMGSAQADVTNGNFATGDFTGWDVIDVAPAPVVDTTTGHSGTDSAYLGSTANPEGGPFSSISQLLTNVPTGASLDFWVFRQTTDGLPWDEQDAYITDAAGTTTLATIFHDCVSDAGWTHITADLYAYAGQDVRIKFVVGQDGNQGGSDPTSMRVTDVSLSITAAPATILAFGPGGVIDQAAKTISVILPYGTDLASYAPTFTIMSGTCNKTSGTAPTPSFAVTDPATYTVTDGATVNSYTVTVTVLPPPPAVLTYNFNDATLQGWHNRVWDLSANSNAGGWVDLAPNISVMPGTINSGAIQPASSNDGLFVPANNVVWVSGNTDAHLNTLWLRSPEVTIAAGGDLTVQLAKGSPHGSAPANENSVPEAAANGAAWMGVALCRASDGVFVLSKARANGGNDNWETVTFTAAELAPFAGVVCTLNLINMDNGGWGWITMDNVSIPGTLTPQASLLTFAVSGGGVSISGTNVSVAVPEGTPLSSLAPTFTLSEGATCDHVSGDAYDFTNPVNYVVTSSDPSISKTYTVTVSFIQPDTTVVWNISGGGTWDTSSFNWLGQPSGTAAIYTDGENVVFNNAAGGIIAVTAGLAPASTLVGGTGTYTFSGGPLAGTGTLTKTGSGTFVPNAVNSYTGKTSVLGGTLQLGNSLTNAGVSGPLGAPTGADATIDLNNGVTLRYQLVQGGPYNTTRPLNLSGTGSGTVSVRVNNNDNIFGFGAVTATGTGAKTLAVYLGDQGNGDREEVAFNGAISDSSDGSPTSLQAHFATQSGSYSFLNLPAVNTFTGPITLVKGNNVNFAYLTVGGRGIGNSGNQYNSVAGSGSLGAGNYPGNISLDTNTILDYCSSADQVLSGVISGAGSVIKQGTGTLSLAGLNTYTTTTTVKTGSLVLTNSGGLKFVVTNAGSNKVTGTGSATIDGVFTIDTTAVTLTAGTWPLVDTTTKSFGADFSVAGFTGPDSNNAWKFEDGTKIWTFDTASGNLYLSAPAQIVAFGIPGAAGVIDQNAMTIALTVPWTPWGASLAALNPSFSVSSGTCNQTSGSAPSPSFGVQNPATYTVTDLSNGITNVYTVTVSITPPATGKAMTNVGITGDGLAWATDGSGLNLEIVVPRSASLSALAPTFSLSAFATSSPASGTVRNFTSPQNYTVTAQDGTTQTYTLTVTRITNVGTGYEAMVLNSGPVSYWPLNETSGTTAVDMASGLNNITYGGTYTLGSAGLRSDGNTSVLFTSTTTADSGNTRVAYNNSLNPKQFSVECWVEPTNTTVQYLVSLQDRTTGSRTGYAIWKNNGSAGFGMQWTSSGTTNPSINGATPALAGQVYHVVGTYDGTTFKLYVNGNLEAFSDSTYVPASAGQLGFTIGSRNGNSAAPSYIQDVALYSRALSAAEILSHYTGAPATLSYADWATAHGISGQVASADADHDGMSNFQEYAFGLNPTSGSSVNPISVPFNKATGTFSYTRTVNTGLTYTVWHSADLVTWTSTGATQGTAVANGGDVETVPVTLDAGLLSAPKLFVRVQAQ